MVCIHIYILYRTLTSNDANWASAWARKRAIEWVRSLPCSCVRLWCHHHPWSLMSKWLRIRKNGFIQPFVAMLKGPISVTEILLLRGYLFSWRIMGLSQSSESPKHPKTHDLRWYNMMFSCLTICYIMLLEFPHRAHPPLVSTLVPTIFNVATAFRHDRSHGIPVGPAKSEYELGVVRSRGCLRNRMGRILLRLQCFGRAASQISGPGSDSRRRNYVNSWAHVFFQHGFCRALQKNTVKHIVKHVTKIYKVVSQSGGNFVDFMTGKNMKIS